MSVRLAVLGQPVIERDSLAISLPAKAVGLLTLLATHDEAQPRERVIEWLWPERDPEASRKNLRNTLWLVRRDLGTNVIDSRSIRLSLGADACADVRAFVAQGALDLYRGPFLDGMSFDDAPEFDQWVSVERDRWQSTFLTLLASAIADRREHRAWEAVAALAQRGLAQAPFDESLHRALMESLARLGRRTEALQHVEQVRAMLDRELGLELSHETLALRDAIMDDRLDVAESRQQSTSNGMLALALSASLSTLPTSPYEMVSPAQSLAQGWALALDHDSRDDACETFAALSDRRRVFDPEIAAQANLELAMMALADDDRDEAQRCLTAAQSETSTGVSFQRLCHGVAAVLDAAGGDEASTWFAREYLPGLLVAARCELVQLLARRGDLTPNVSAMMERFALRKISV